MRAGKAAIVTGSTSGTGLGIATALAGQGANIVLNGFGPADEIDILPAMETAARPYIRQSTLRRVRVRHTAGDHISRRSR